jgi:hypothetical protein
LKTEISSRDNRIQELQGHLDFQLNEINNIKNNEEPRENHIRQLEQ